MKMKMFSRKASEGQSRTVTSNTPLKGQSWIGKRLSIVGAQIMGRKLSGGTKHELVIKDAPMEYVPQKRRQSEIDREKLYRDLGKETADVLLNVAEEFMPDNGDAQYDMSVTTMMFCGNSVPTMSLILYLSRLVRNINHAHSEDENGLESVGMKALLTATIYLTRLQRKLEPDFTINNLNIHRLFFVAITDALKFSEDDAPNNKYMSLVGGLSVESLNQLELAFCLNNQFDMTVKFEELEFAYQKYVSKTYQLKKNDPIGNEL